MKISDLALLSNLVFFITDFSGLTEAFAALGFGIKTFIYFQDRSFCPRTLGGLANRSFIEGIAHANKHLLVTPFSFTIFIMKIRIIVKYNKNASH